MAEDDTLVVEVQYDGNFITRPFMYFDPHKKEMRFADFKEKGYLEFVAHLDAITNRKCKDIYYCPDDQTLCEGLATLQNECDYHEFLEYIREKKKVKVYVDHMHEPLFDWIEMEEPEDNTNSNEDDDEDSLLGDKEGWEHEVDDEDVSMKRERASIQHKDRFLNKLCPDVEEEEVPNAEQLPPIYPVHNSEQQWDEMTPVLGMKFTNPSELKDYLSNYAVKGGYDLWYEKNTKDRLLVKCCKGKEPTCPFRLWASWMQEERTFQIKTLKSTHNCGRAFKLGSIVTYKWIGKKYFNVLLENPKLSLRKMKSQISKEYNIIVSIGQCRNAKRFALSEIEGTLKEHYSRLWDYGLEIKRANPGTSVDMEVDHVPDGSIMFKRFYVCFKGLRDGWVEGCRNIIGIDGCFLKGICKGELLAVVGRDSNNHMFPIAWAVVTVENKDTWKWFLDLLMDDIEGGNGNGLTLISDGHKGLIEAIKERVPDAEHRLCARHILANFNTRFKGEHFIKPFWKAVKATTKQKHEAAMQEIKELDIRAFDYLMERDPKIYCRAFQVEGVFCDAVENGVSESFNAEIVDARHKPIIAMLEDIRVYVMQRLYHHRRKGECWDLTICPAIRKEIEDLKVQQRFWAVYPSGYQQFEVVSGNNRCAIDLGRRTCGCRGWQLTGIPCVHGVAAISSMNLKSEDYVATCYSKATYLTCYTYNIHPLNDSSLWPQSEYTKPLPPKSRRLPGRPTTKRKKSAAEREITSRHSISRAKQVQRCSVCYLSGHKKNGCPSKRIPTTGDPFPGSATPTPNPYPTPIPTPASTQRSSPTSTQRSTPASTQRSTSAGPGPSEVQMRKRKQSERIIKQSLRKRVVPNDGSGCSVVKPVSLD